MTQEYILKETADNTKTVYICDSPEQDLLQVRLGKKKLDRPIVPIWVRSVNKAVKFGKVLVGMSSSRSALRS